MSLMQRPHRADTIWPSWLAGNPLVDWPNWRNLTGEPDMKVEEFVEDGRLVVRAELPGIDPERDVEITVRDRTLTMRAERRREERSEDQDGYRSEFTYGSFTRTLQLPDGTTDADIEATYRDGILEMRVPIASASDARKVTVTRS